MSRHLKLYAFLLQVVIPVSWIFSLIVNTPYFLVVNEDNACMVTWVFGEDWMPIAYDLFWSAIVVVAMVMMAGL